MGIPATSDSCCRAGSGRVGRSAAAKRFLEDIIHGANLVTGVFRAGPDLAKAEVFTHALRSVGIPQSGTPQFIEKVERFRSAIASLLSGEGLEQPELSELDTFFSRQSQADFRRTRALLESA